MVRRVPENLGQMQAAQAREPVMLAHEYAMCRFPREALGRLPACAEGPSWVVHYPRPRGAQLSAWTWLPVRATPDLKVHAAGLLVAWEEGNLQGGELVVVVILGPVPALGDLLGVLVVGVGQVVPRPLLLTPLRRVDRVDRLLRAVDRPLRRGAAFGLAAAPLAPPTALALAVNSLAVAAPVAVASAGLLFVSAPLPLLPLYLACVSVRAWSAPGRARKLGTTGSPPPPRPSPMHTR